MNMKNLICFFLLLLIKNSAFSQAGLIDSTFNTFDNSTYSNVDNITRTSIIQPDGKIILGGEFTSCTANRIIRLNPDGKVDSTFITGSGFNGRVWTMSLQLDGKIIVGGNFTSFNGNSANHIVRLNSDGSIDNSFITGSGLIYSSPIIDGWIYASAIQQDGKILIGGWFDSYNGTSAEKLVRLNTDGSIDPSFNTGTGFNAAVWDLNIHNDGKILATGEFTSYNGTIVNKIVRLNSNGSIDPSFIAGTGFNQSVYDAKIKPDGKIILCGRFTSYNGNTRNYIVQLNSDGTIDNSFNIGTGFGTVVNPNNVCGTLSLDANQKILVGGAFISYNGTPKNYLIRLNSNGSIDNSFNVNFQMTNAATGFLYSNITSNNKIIVSGFITSTFRNYTLFLNPDGSADYSFIQSGLNGTVYATAIQQDGKIITVGDFSSFNNLPNNRIVKVNNDGSVDLSFNPSLTIDKAIRTVKIQSDGKILIAGDFNAIMRLNNDGTIDSSWPSTLTTDGAIYSIAIQSDGKILVAGNFTNIGGVTRNRIVRLNSNGSIDYSLFVNQGFNGIVRSMDIQSDGKIVVVGEFSNYNGTNVTRIVRLNNNGNIDASFTGGAGSSIFAVCNQPDGKIIVGGDFTLYNVIYNKNRISRLNSNGSLDASFSIGSGFNGRVNCFSLQSDGKIIVGGLFTTYNGYSCNYIVRLNPDGTRDVSFDTGSGFNNQVQTTAIQSDGKILVGGDFNCYNGNQKNRLIRLIECSIPSLSINNPSFCQGSSTTVIVSSSNLLNNNFSWAVPSGFSNPGNVSSFSTNIPGQYSVVVTNNTCVSSPLNSLVSSYSSPQISISSSGNSTICVGDSVVLNSNSSGTGTFQWYENNNAILGATYSTYNTSVAGSFSVQITDINGCSNNSNSIQVTVNPLPIVDAGNDQTICSGASVALTGAGAVNYMWNNNVYDGIAFTPNATNTYIVTGTNTNGCSNTDQVTVIVNPLPIVNAGNDQTICAGASVTLTGTGATNYIWNNSVNDGVAFTPNVTNTYIVIGTNINGCSNTDQVTVIVNPLPLVNAGQDQTICEGDMITLSASGSSNYSWTNNVQNNIPFSPSITQSYTVTGTDNNNCSAFDNVLVTVNMNSAATQSQTALDNYTWPVNGQTYSQSGVYTAAIPNALGCDSTITLNLSISYSGISELDENINIYPNPTNGNITLEVSSELVGKRYSIRDFSGRTIRDGKITSTQEQIDLQNVARGAYYLSIDNSSSVTKLIKQ